MFSFCVNAEAYGRFRPGRDYSRGGRGKSGGGGGRRNREREREEWKERQQKKDDMNRDRVSENCKI